MLAVWRRADPLRQFLFLDDNRELQGTQVAGTIVAGTLQAIPELVGTADAALVAIGNNYVRTELARKIGHAVCFANAIDPSAVIMPEASLGVGIVVGPQAVVHTGARIGDHAVINTGSIIEHDSVVEEGASISPGVRMAGRVHIGKHAFLAAGVTLVGRVCVGAGAIVGAGAVVTADIPPGAVAYGVPARVLREASPRDWKRLF